MIKNPLSLPAKQVSTPKW